MDMKNSFWGGVTGKIVAACLVLAFVLGVVVLCFVHEKHADILLDVDEIDISDYEYNAENGILTLKIKLKKSGYVLSDVDSYEKEYGTGKNINTKLMVRFYASLSEGDYKADSNGFYTVTLKIDNEDITSIIQEGKDYNNGTIANLHS